MPEIDALMSSADRFRLNSTRSSPLLMECQSLSDVKLGPSACEVQCRTSGQETPSTRSPLLPWPKWQLFTSLTALK
ncbi:uncharacterized protein LOC141866951 isoform X2 [Acropora palmata]|uniref:uncharacterized protein LOC141866951 isoform X2 n=1 Tax=Acropora palmata TaxID=6131 RepID=UPI003DA022C9